MMFEEYNNAKHRSQVESFIFSIGNFTIEFERVCESMRYSIIALLRSQGLSNQSMANVIVGDKTSAELQLLLGALYSEFPNQDKEDKNVIKNLLKDIKELTNSRNILLHNSWQFGAEASQGEFIAAAVRYRAKQNKGGSPEIHGYSSKYIDKLADEAKKIYVLLGRLNTCICQPRLKVKNEFAKPL